jgi:hypothetical protein
MKIRTKIWLGVGAVVLAGAGGHGGLAIAGAPLPGASPAAAGSSGAQPLASGGHLVAQHNARQSGQGGEGDEGGAKAAKPSLPPDLDFALKIGELRGHLLVGDELVKQGQWNAALPHFLHPTEEIYGSIRAQLRDYNTPPFEAALKSLAAAVKAKKGGEDYAKAASMVADALAAADAGLRAKHAEDWGAFSMQAALELLKASSSEYEEAIVKGRIAKPVEYQDARGFIWEAERMVESVAPTLEKKDADALAHVRAALNELKKAFPAAIPPKTLVKDYGAVLGDIARIELAAGRLM